MVQMAMVPMEAAMIFVGVIFACHLSIGCYTIHTGEYDTYQECWADVRSLAAVLVEDEHEEARAAFCARKVP